MSDRPPVEAILTLLACVGWIVVGAVVLRRGASPIGLRQRPLPTIPRTLLVATLFLLLVVAVEYVHLLQMGFSPARIGQVLLLRDLGEDLGSPTRLDFLWHRRTLGVFYGLYLMVLIFAFFFPRDLAEPDRFSESRVPGKAIDVSDEWKERCDAFRSRNRLWLLLGMAWLLAAGAVAGLAYWDVLPGMVGMHAVLFLILGIAVFGIASTLIPRRLDCPNCGCTPLRYADKLHRWLDDIKECERCHARLA